MALVGDLIDTDPTQTERKKNPLVANVAIARELSGWCWSLATM